MDAKLERYRRIADTVMETWTAQNVEDVLGCYSSDLVYVDPNTRGPVTGRDAMRRYLTKLFARWTMTWRAGEMFPFEGADAVAIRWTATLAPTGDGRSVTIDGLDLVFLEGDLIARNEVFYDRAALAPLLAPAQA